MHSIFAGLAFILTSSQITLIKGDYGRNGYSDDTEKREMSYNPELSYKMAILSAVTYDQSRPQHCLDQYLPLTKFQLQTVVTKKCDFLDNKCAGYVAVSHSLRVLVVAFRGTESTSHSLSMNCWRPFLPHPKVFLMAKFRPISRRPLKIYGSAWSRK